MAVQTIKATIQMRKGAEQNFDPSQMTAGEWAVSTDSKKVWMCFSPGIVRRMATYEAFEQDMREIQLILATCQNIQAAVERFMQLAQQHASQAEEWSVTSKSWAVGGTGTRQGENTNNSQYWSQQSQNHSNMSKSWAIGEGNLRPDEAVNSAKYFADQAGKIVDAAGSGGLIPMGTVTFENLPTSGMKKGWMYNISNDFTSDSRFEDGGGIKYNAGSNVYYTAVGKWDVLAGRQVSGVKGSVETSYRTGDVNITKANIGLENVPNVTTNNQTPTFTQASTRVNIASGEKLSVIFGKLMKWYADLETVAFSGSYTDLSNKPTIPTNMTGATASAAGKAGLAPAPGAGKQNAYLRGDGTWVAPATTLTGTVAGIPLDQTMGKKLDDKISVINSNLSGKADKTVTVDINNSSGVYHGETFPFGVKMLTGFKKSANYNLSRAYGNAFYTDFSIALPTFFNNISCAIVQLYSSAGAYVTVTGWSDREITGYIIGPENTAINAALQFIIYGT